MGGREGYFGEEEGELEAGEAVLVDVLEGLVHLPQPLPLHPNAMLSASDQLRMEGEHRDWYTCRSRSRCTPTQCSHAGCWEVSIILQVCLSSERSARDLASSDARTRQPLLVRRAGEGASEAD